MQKAGYDFKRDIQMIALELKNDDEFAKEFYGALCNMRWRSKVDPDIIYSCSWRYAGGIVADLRRKGERYIDFYCSGGEGIVTKRVEKLLGKLGWEPCSWTGGDYD
jgi:hypothetical protein